LRDQQLKEKCQFIVGTGEGYANLLETCVLSVAISYHLVWAKNNVDLDELASHFGCGRTTIIRKIAFLRKNPDLIQDGRARSHLKTRKYRFMGQKKA
jgi:hypothetical protein